MFVEPIGDKIPENKQCVIKIIGIHSEWYLYILLVIFDRGFTNITLSLFVKHVLYTLVNDSICYGFVHRLSTSKLLLFIASKE